MQGFHRPDSRESSGQVLEECSSTSDHHHNIMSLFLGREPPRQTKLLFVSLEGSDEVHNLE